MRKEPKSSCLWVQPGENGGVNVARLILQLFTDGFKVPKAHALDIVQSLDMYHWMRDKALIIAFSRRLDLKYIKSLRKNLALFAPHRNPISVKDDLEPRQLATEKECSTKFKALRTANPAKSVKIVSFNKIAVDNVVKLYSEW